MDNQRDVYEKAIELNGGDSANMLILLRGIKKKWYIFDKSTCNTEQLIKILQNTGKGLVIMRSFNRDLCFTTDGFGNKKGIPSHTYIFMGWVEEGKFDYAYICDNQAKL